MYNLLVVDDEAVAVRGIVEGIDWSVLPIAEIYSACDAEEAREIMGSRTVHVMISDIDMPSENGLHLLKWTKEHSPGTETILLTGHADFAFAQQAVQLNGFDYLLKPIDHDLLRDCVGKALGVVREREQDLAFRRTYEYYYEQWNRQLPLLVERFWQDVLNLRIGTAPAQLQPLFKLYGLKLEAETPVLPLLISVERWRQEWSARDEEILSYALQNAASEILLRDWDGHVVHVQNGMLVALVYDPGEEALRSEVPGRCEEYIRKCGEYLYAEVSCYIGEAVPIAGLRACVHALTEMERSNIAAKRSVLRLAPAAKRKKPSASAPNWPEWAALAEQGKRAELLRRVESLFDTLRAEQVDYTYMVNYYFGLVHCVFQILQRRSLSPSDVYADEAWRNGERAMRSLDALRDWSVRFLGTAADYLAAERREASNAIIKVQRYIERNLDRELSREALAEHVYLNQAYLSRLFHKETGKSITDYIAELRVEKAKESLAKTNEKIGEIAASVGYTNFSHFSQLFRKLTGFTPQDYRRKHQDVT
ncbi:helix-turn-helix domain-containing protein [Cohnella xylanilytica]|uniref:Helix-turn-helix domain-containing protein n=1 Tax=Cohnella xylanilytica TaxID=557555 RepID=A0A841U9K3_9BACL|nr:helix-turn-helix domain-containing protein [Cohnella xylanilytica]MBB6694913.1 helix-turn-helix domain-containing protein [Cohnella xylanilytica]